MKKSLKAIVKGRVQGVGYRYFTLNKAKELGLSGFVRNLPDKTVEVVAEGESHLLKLLVESLKRGPFSAKVEKLDLKYYNYSGKYNEFKIN
ncbi:MAG: acylphosphatase [Candidatus Muiribacteriota bacterium]